MSIRGSVLRVEMLKGSKGATGLENEPRMLVFEGGDGVGVNGDVKGSARPESPGLGLAFRAYGLPKLKPKP